MTGPGSGASRPGAWLVGPPARGVRRWLLCFPHAGAGPGVGEEDIDRPILVLGRSDQRLDVGFLADIGGHRQRVDVAGDFCQAVAR